MIEENFILNSKRSEIKYIEERLNRINEFLKIDMVRFLNFQIAVSEALVNAIVHGNKESELKKVYVDIYETEEHLGIRIKDEGTGFDHNSLPDPTAKDNLLKESGRGIFIIKSLVDEYSLNSDETGTELILVIKKADSGESA